MNTLIKTFEFIKDGVVYNAYLHRINYRDPESKDLDLRYYENSKEFEADTEERGFIIEFFIEQAFAWADLNGFKIIAF